MFLKFGNSLINLELVSLIKKDEKVIRAYEYGRTGSNFEIYHGADTQRVFDTIVATCVCLDIDICEK